MILYCAQINSNFTLYCISWSLPHCQLSTTFLSPPISVVFGILQARDKGRLCWRSKSHYAPSWTSSKSHYDGVGVAPSYTGPPDSDTETDLYQSFKYRYMTLFPQTHTLQHQHEHCSGVPHDVWPRSPAAGYLTQVLAGCLLLVI